MTARRWSEGETGEIDSTITGSDYQLIKDDDGTLILGAGPSALSGGVTVGSLIDEGPGTLSLNGSTTITNTDNGGAGSNIGLTVAGSASITGSGPLDLQSADGSFNYESTAPNDGTTPGSIYSGPISGAGGVGLLSAMVQKSVRCVEHGASRAMVRCAKPPTGWVTVNGGLTPRAQRTVNGGLRFTHPTRAVFRSARARFALASVFATYARAAVVALVLLLAGSAFAGTVSIALVPVGDPGNVADPATNFGAVAYPYSMGEYDVTMGQYTAFLNAVATTGDPYGLWTVSMSSATPTYGITRTTTSGSFSYSLVGNSANVPVTEVSWGDAARFVNWLQNGEPNAPEGQGTTETGTYALNGSTGSCATDGRDTEHDSQLGDSDGERMVQVCVLRWWGYERGLLALSDAEQQSAEQRAFGDRHEQCQFHGHHKHPSVRGSN